MTRLAALIVLAFVALADARASAAELGAEEGEAIAEPIDPAKTTWLPQTLPGIATRVQRRLVLKQGRWFVDGGFEYLARGDFYLNPGAAVAASRYSDEHWAADFAVSKFFPVLMDVADEIRQRSGYVPDAQPAGFLLRAGVRRSIGYGKLLFGERIVHLEPQAFLRAALMTGDSAVAPGGDLGFTFLIHWGARFHTRLDLAILVTGEKRTKWVPVVGAMPFLSFGYGTAP